MKRRAIIVGGLAALAGCARGIRRDGSNEAPPAVAEVRFRNDHDRPHEVGVAFTADGEELFAHTSSLPAARDGTSPTAAVHPEIPERNWLLHGYLDGEEPKRAIPQGRIEYPRVEVLCRVSTGGTLGIRISAP